MGEVFQKVYSKNQVSLDGSEIDYDDDLPRFHHMSSASWFYKGEFSTAEKVAQNFFSLSGFYTCQLYKEYRSSHSLPLGKYIQFELNRAEVPVRWHAFVATTSKKAPQSEGNYRQVSITSIIARTFEKILEKHILIHLKAHNVISSDQHGCMKGTSVETDLLTSLNDWSKAFDERKRSDAV